MPKPETKENRTVAEDVVRRVMETLAATYHGSGAVELGDPYKVLVATIISQRTREEQTTAVSERLFAVAPDATHLAALEETELYELLHGSEYREEKAPRMLAMAKILVEQYEGKIPDDLDALLALPGVGRKTASCTLIYAFQKDALCIDTHFHRITNRLGWVTTKTPDGTEKAIEKILPRDWWQGSNRLFLQHGRTLCPPSIPRCSRCPIRTDCTYGRDATTPKR